MDEAALAGVREHLASKEPATRTEGISALATAAVTDPNGPWRIMERWSPDDLGVMTALTGDSDLLAIDLLERLLGRERPTPEEEAVRRVLLLLTEASSGGLRQYYENSCGDEALDAAGALRRIGADTHADLLARANGLFGDAGPAADGATRRAQLAGLMLDGDDRLSRISGTFRKEPGNFDALLRRFVAAHRQAFGP